jgi:hypothetical protein
MNPQLPTATTNRLLRRGLLGVAIATCALAAVGCSSSTTGTAHSTTLPCGSLPGCTPPPPSPSTSVPLGLPVDWSTQAIHAATTAFQTCVKATSLQPPNCPQSLGGGEVLAVHWTSLNQALDHAVAVPVPVPDGATPTGQVTVYGQYQMEVSYTTTGQTLRPYLDYVGGIAAATMTWDGHSFQNVQFSSSDSASSQPAPTLPPFARPTEVTDAAALAAVKAGFADCATLPVPLTAVGLVIPNCPQLFAVIQVGTVTSAQWTVTGDPMQGALVSFDTAHGNVAVTGSYHMDVHYSTANGNALSPDNGAHAGNASGNYTAILDWDGHQLKLLKITAS